MVFSRIDPWEILIREECFGEVWRWQVCNQERVFSKLGFRFWRRVRLGQPSAGEEIFCVFQYGEKLFLAYGCSFTIYAENIITALNIEYLD